MELVCQAIEQDIRERWAEKYGSPRDPKELDEMVTRTLAGRTDHDKGLLRIFNGSYSFQYLVNVIDVVQPV